jgi:hypothetical protein
MQKFYHNIGFWEKRQLFRRKMSKIAENRDHNIDPWRWTKFLYLSTVNAKLTQLLIPPLCLVCNPRVNTYMPCINGCVALTAARVGVLSSKTFLRWSFQTEMQYRVKCFRVCNRFNDVFLEDLFQLRRNRILNVFKKIITNWLHISVTKFDILVFQID